MPTAAADQAIGNTWHKHFCLVKTKTNKQTKPTWLNYHIGQSQKEHGSQCALENVRMHSLITQSDKWKGKDKKRVSKAMGALRSRTLGTTCCSGDRCPGSRSARCAGILMYRHGYMFPVYCCVRKGVCVDVCDCVEAGEKLQKEILLTSGASRATRELYPFVFLILYLQATN